MKKSLLYTILLTVSLASCSGFLSEEPKLTQSDVLTTSSFDGLSSTVAGAYGPFNSASWYGGNYVLTGELASGNARNPITYSGSGRYLTASKWSFDESVTSPIWSYCYYVISAVNNVINSLDGKTTSEVTQQDVDNIHAEALFLRAWCYHALVTTYALPYTTNKDALGVPLVLVTENGKPARETVGKVYEQIVADLTDAEKLMSDTYVRGFSDPAAAVSKYTIKAFLSRVYLYMGEWQKAADYATEIINSGKYKLQSGDDYLAMFTAATAPKNGEIIFEMYSSKSNGYWDESGWTQNSYITSSTGSADVCASDQLVALFGAKDIRAKLYELKNSKDNFCLKYAGKAGSIAPKENNTILIRLSEMYLNRAEALANGATISGVSADADMQTLLSARGVESTGATATTILRERRKELAFEGHYFYDAKRTGTAVTTENKDQTSVTIEGNSKRWAMPIPKHETDVNENCVQNTY